MIPAGRAGRWARAAALIASLGIAAPALADPPEAATTKTEAFAHFDKGLALYDRGAWAAALAEFLEARRLYPLRNAVYQAGLCLENLQRYDEALDRFEATLRDFGEAMPPDVKERVQRKVVEMRGLVGEVVVDGAEPGATVTVDDLARGEHPLLAPLRVAAGSHLVRISKAGFESFEARVVVAGGQTERVVCHLAPLGPAGRVRITELGGRTLDVLVDGSRMGTSPWEGPLAPGPHVVVLRGEGDLGTPPVQVTVEVDRTTPLTLAAAELGAALRVTPVPVNASVAIDGVTVGRGIWDGRLLAGAHRIEIAAPGFLTVRDELVLTRGARRVARVELQRDPRSPFAGQAARFTAEIAVGIPQLAAFYGQVGDSCNGACTGPLDYTGYAALRAGYELGSRAAFGIAVGALGAGRGFAQRPSSVAVAGSASPCTAAAADTVWVHAALLGPWAQVTFGDRLAFHLRLGAGGMVGSSSDTRSGTAVDCARTAVAPVTETSPLHAVYLAPEARVGLALGRHVEMTLGLEVLLAFNLDPPSWSGAHDGVTWDPPAGTATFSSQRLIAFTPVLGGRYDF
jgi:PEGA domain